MTFHRHQIADGKVNLVLIHDCAISEHDFRLVIPRSYDVGIVVGSPAPVSRRLLSSPDRSLLFALSFAEQALGNTSRP